MQYGRGSGRGHKRGSPHGWGAVSSQVGMWNMYMGMDMCMDMDMDMNV